MADLSFRPDPEPHPEAAPKTQKQPPTWLAGCKSSMLTVLAFLFLLTMTFGMCAGFFATNHHIGDLNRKIDELQKDVSELKERKSDDKRVMPPAGD